MITVSFSSFPYRADDERVALSSTGVTHLGSYAERDGVAYLAKSGYLTLAVSPGLFTENTLVLTLSFSIGKDSGDSRTLICCDGLPLALNLRLRADGYHLEAQLKHTSGNYTFIGPDPIAPETWHEMTLFLLDGQMVLTLDGKPQGRRVFPGVIGLAEKWSLFIGKRVNTTVLGGFTGHLDSLTLNDVLAPEQEALVLSLSEEGAGEMESKVSALKSQGVDTGALLQEHVQPSPAHPYFYNRYQNGGIFWSSSYGCVWLSTPLLNTYLNALQGTVIGLPMTDEVVAERYGAVYCFCEAVGLLWDGTACYLIPADFMTVYANEGLTASLYGLPTSQPKSLTLLDGTSVSYQLFSGGAFFKGYNLKKPTPLVVLPLWVADVYLADPNAYGIPTAYRTGYRGNIKDDFSVTQYVQADYFCTDKTTLCCNTFTDALRNEIHQWFIPDPHIFAYFEKSGGLSGAGDEPYGRFKCLISPRTVSKKGTVYHDCAEGVLVHYPADPEDLIYPYTEITVTLRQISCVQIDDGLDSSPELYIDVTPFRNDVAIAPQTRWPETGKHGESKFPIIYTKKHSDPKKKLGSNVFYTFPHIHGGDVLHIQVLPKDYDLLTGNDSLGRISIRLDVETGWGLKEDFLREDDHLAPPSLSFSGTSATYIGMYLTDTYGDTRGGRSNIQLNFDISSEALHFDLESNFRKFGFWSIDNFTSAVPLSHDDFNRTFAAQTNHWYDWILHFWDEVWYEAAKDNYDGSGGNCFGLSTEALLCLHGAGSFRLPLNDHALFSEARSKEMEENGILFGAEGPVVLANYPKKAEYDAELANISDAQMRNARRDEIEKYRLGLQRVDTSNDLHPGFFSLIRQKHLYQLGWDHVNMVVNLAIDRELFFPERAFAHIKDLLDKEKYCLVNCFMKGAHTVLAYGAEVVDGKDHILIADCNYPWWTDTSNINGSYLVLTDDTIPKVEIHYSLNGVDDSYKTYAYCYPTPYAILLNHPRVPSWLELTAFTITTLLRIPEFLVKNFAQFLCVIASGDAEISITDGEGEGFVLPCFNAILPDKEGGMLRLTVVPKEEANIQLNGNAGKDFKVFVAGRGKAYRLQGKLEAKGTVFEARRMSRRDGKVRLRPDATRVRTVQPQITTLKTGAAPFGKAAMLPKRFDRTTRKPNDEKRYYLNRHRQKNGVLEVHTEDCPFLPKILKTEYLGIHKTPQSAFAIALDYAEKVDGCRFCCGKANFA